VDEARHWLGPPRGQRNLDARHRRGRGRRGRRTAQESEDTEEEDDADHVCAILARGAQGRKCGITSVAKSSSERSAASKGMLP
jgi:hypothetical protein